ncbi:MAG: hypothetical protein WD229_17735, partial [Pirellulales bacterium]
VIGAIMAAIVGIATPIVLYLYYRITHPGLDGGVGTVYAMMMLITVPGFTGFGVVVGAVVGAVRD